MFANETNISKDQILDVNYYISPLLLSTKSKIDTFQ